jgi:hypothetical protein
MKILATRTAETIWPKLRFVCPLSTAPPLKCSSPALCMRTVREPAISAATSNATGAEAVRRLSCSGGHWGWRTEIQELRRIYRRAEEYDRW